jgi:polysaccharide biosynthesis/export protein
MKSTPFRRAVAVVLCFQPTFWMSGVAFAQGLESRAGATTPPSSSAPPSSPSIASPFSSPFADPVPYGSMPSAPGSAPPVDEPVDPSRYVCGSGDVLDLNFWGIQNFKLRVTLDLEGRGFVPKIGYLELGGKTLTEARRMIRESVARYYPRLGFDVTLTEPRTFLVQVADDVERPGSYPARGTDRVSALIARAGGYGKNASKRRVEIRRRDGTVIQTDLLRFEQTGDVKHNPHLLDGDVVRVPFARLMASIDGAVNRPGTYELVGAGDLAELVELAGGVTPAATFQLPLRIVRRLADERQHQELLSMTPEGGLPAAAVRHEDSVWIPGYRELLQSVVVIGAIAGVATPTDAAATRRLPFVQGDSVRTLLERAGGVGPLADLAGAYVIRGSQSLPIDLYTIVMLRDLKADRAVEIGDTLVIPFQRRGVVVQGAVFKPGEYQHNPSFGVEQYLSLAGGPNRFAKSLSSARVVTPAGVTKKYRADLAIEPGSQVVMPERNFSPAELVQIALGAASVLVSGVAVMLAARK